MGKNGGCLFIFREARRVELLRTRATEDRSFTDVVSQPDFQLKAVDLCFISFNGKEISYAALLVRRGSQKAATAKYRVEFSQFVEFQPISFDEIQENIEPKFRSHFIRASRDIGQAT